MRIHIIGPGVVGKATGSGFARFGYEVIYTDKGDDHAIEADFHFVCVPEVVVPEVVHELDETIPAGGLIVIRSSVPPGTTKHLAQATLRFLVHAPEFLKEATAEADFLDSKIVVLGAADGRGPSATATSELLIGPDDLSGLFVSIGKDVRWVLSDDSELLKLAMNSYLACLVSYWNQVKAIGDKIGVNSHLVAKLAVDLDSRVSPYGALRHGQAYGGRCLPKDIYQLRKVASDANVVQYMLWGIESMNAAAG